MDTEQIRKRANDAPPGPWSWRNYRQQPDKFIIQTFGGNDVAAVQHYAPTLAEGAATFIANAREDVPALIDAVAELRAVLAPLLDEPIIDVAGEFEVCRFCGEGDSNAFGRTSAHAPECPVLRANELLGHQSVNRVR